MGQTAENGLYGAVKADRGMAEICRQAGTGGIGQAGQSGDRQGGVVILPLLVSIHTGADMNTDEWLDRFSESCRTMDAIYESLQRVAPEFLEGAGVTNADEFYALYLDNGFPNVALAEFDFKMMVIALEAFVMRNSVSSISVPATVH